MQKGTEVLFNVKGSKNVTYILKPFYINSTSSFQTFSVKRIKNKNRTLEAKKTETNNDITNYGSKIAKGHEFKNEICGYFLELNTT